MVVQICNKSDMLSLSTYFYRQQKNAFNVQRATMNRGTQKYWEMPIFFKCHFKFGKWISGFVIF